MKEERERGEKSARNKSGKGNMTARGGKDGSNF